MKLAIVVGHNSVKQGAVRKDTGETEFQFNTRLASRIRDRAESAGLDVKVFFRQDGLGYRAELQKVYSEVDAWGADGSIELHFNSFHKDSATGTETLSSGTPLSMRLATEVQSAMVHELGLKDRGIITKARDERGGGSLYSGKAPAILIEPFFGSNEHGTAATDTSQEMNELAWAILRGARQALEGFPRKNLSESRTLKGTARQRITASVGAVSTAAGTIGNQLIGDAGSAIDAVQEATRWSDYVPDWAGTALIVLGVCAFFYLRYTSDKIEEARLDDHENGRR